MIKAKIFVQLKPSVLDPQGKAVTTSLHHLGYDSVTDTRISKYIELSFASDDATQVEMMVGKICKDLLANPNTEIYHYQLEKQD